MAFGGNYISAIKEKHDALGLGLPEYTYESQGPDHVRTFRATVAHPSWSCSYESENCQWFGTKKEAQQDAAKRALERELILGGGGTGAAAAHALTEEHTLGGEPTPAMSMPAPVHTSTPAAHSTDPSIFISDDPNLSSAVRTLLSGRSDVEVLSWIEFRSRISVRSA